MKTISVNRAPVLTLWASVVAERLGYDRAEALTFGRAVAGMNAQSKGRRLGIYAPRTDAEPPLKRRRARVEKIELLGRSVAAVRTKDGLRAVKDDVPESPAAVERYLASKLGDALAPVRAALVALARSLPRDELAERAYELYEQFRPRVASGAKGWGQKGTLDLARIAALAGRSSG
jgi:hypothetical protein